MRTIKFAGLLGRNALIGGVKINLLHYIEFYLFLSRALMIIKVIGVFGLLVGVFEEGHTAFHSIYNLCIFIRLADTWL